MLDDLCNDLKDDYTTLYNVKFSYHMYYFGKNKKAMEYSVTSYFVNDAYIFYIIDDIRQSNKELYLVLDTYFPEGPMGKQTSSYTYAPLDCMISKCFLMLLSRISYIFADFKYTDKKLIEEGGSPFLHINDNEFRIVKDDDDMNLFEFDTYDYDDCDNQYRERNCDFTNLDDRYTEKNLYYLINGVSMSVDFYGFIVSNK